MTGLDIQVERHEDYAILRPAGELDIATVADLRGRVVEIIESGCVDLVVDLSAVTFIDSSGLGVIVGTMKRATAAGGRLVVTGIDAPAVANPFRVSGLNRVVSSAGSADRAVAALRG